jgi:hypothetical protein
MPDPRRLLPVLRKDLRPFHEPLFLIAIGAAAILLGSIGVLAGIMQ